MKLPLEFFKFVGKGVVYGVVFTAGSLATREVAKRLNLIEGEEPKKKTAGGTTTGSSTDDGDDDGDDL